MMQSSASTATACVFENAASRLPRQAIRLLRDLTLTPAETVRDLECRLDELVHDLVDAVVRQPERGSRDAHRGHHVAVRVADRRRRCGETDLELVDREGVALLPDPG